MANKQPMNFLRWDGGTRDEDNQTMARLIKKVLVFGSLLLNTCWGIAHEFPESTKKEQL